MRVSESVFSCNSDYEESTIMSYDLEGVEGRPALFRFTDPSTPVRLSMLQLNFTKDDGTLDPDDFRNKFYTNTYTNCNQ